MSDIDIEELEKQWRIATRPAPDDVTEEMGLAWAEAHEYLAEMGEALAQRVVADAAKLREAREALAKYADAEHLARSFHGVYEVTAPKYGYKTRKESAVRWNDVPEQNKRVMIETAAIIGAASRTALAKLGEATS